MLFASVIDLVCRVILVFGKGIKTFTEGEFGAFFMEWIALPLVVLFVSLVVYCFCRNRKG